MPKKNAKKFKYKKTKKRNYNKMIEESKLIKHNTNLKDENNKYLKPSLKIGNTNTYNDEKKINSIFNFNFDFDKEYMPPYDIIEKQSNNRKLNLEIYKIIVEHNEAEIEKDKLKNLKFNENCFLIENIHEDGNCYYRSISSFISGTEEYHIFFRNLTYDYIMAHFNDIIVEYPYVYYNGKAIDTDDYIPLIKQKGQLAGELEANILAKILNINNIKFILMFFISYISEKFLRN